MDDDRGRALLAIAGASLHPPQDEYIVAGLPFGSARLYRAEKYSAVGQYLTLTLTAAAAARSAADDGGSDATTVSFRAPHVDVYAASAGFLSEALAPGILPLILDEQLLSRPALLLGPDVPREPQGPAAATLKMMSEQLREAIAPKVQPHQIKGFHVCDACKVVRKAAIKRANEAAIAQTREALSAARSRRDAIQLQRELAWRLQRLLDSHHVVPPPTQNCPHAPWMFAAVQSLCARHTELLFEILGVIHPAPELSPPRFVLSREVFKVILGQWLMGRNRPDPYASWRSSFRGATSRRFSSRRARIDETATLPPEQRNVLSFAASAWGTDTPLSALATRPEKAPAFVLDTAVSSDDQLDVAIELPDPLDVPAPEVPARKAPWKTRKVKSSPRRGR